MFELPTFGRKRTKKNKIENLYKILGTRSNIGQNRIKEKYIEKLKEFPPETHPDEFEEIRNAYEVLKDVKKRKQYDIRRKYGDTIEQTIEDIEILMLMGDWEKAKELLNYILKIDPDNIGAKLTLAELSLELDEFEQFNSIIDDVIENIEPMDREFIVLIKSTMLSSHDYNDKALDVLEEGKEYITDRNMYHKARMSIFINSGNYNEAWEEFNYILPSKEEQNIEHLQILIGWLNTAMELEKWGDVSKIQKRFQSLLKSLVEEDELYIFKNQLIEEIEDYIENVRFREADAFIQILIKLDSKDSYINELRKKIQPVVKLDIELSRAHKDLELFPYVFIKTLDLYLMKYSSTEYYDSFLSDYPHAMMNDMKDMDMEIGYGVLRIKKRYPNLYKEFKKELEIIFNKSTESLNREQKRMLR